jgi:hypothetical protein
MIDVESYRQYAADCLRQAEGEDSPDDRNILLNVALAWLRLAQQTEASEFAAIPANEPDESSLVT